MTEYQKNNYFKKIIFYHSLESALKTPFFQIAEK